jgi:hypothetical protein
MYLNGLGVDGDCPAAAPVPKPECTEADGAAISGTNVLVSNAECFFMKKLFM